MYRPVLYGAVDKHHLKVHGGEHVNRYETIYDLDPERDILQPGPSWAVRKSGKAKLPPGLGVDWSLRRFGGHLRGVVLVPDAFGW